MSGLVVAFYFSIIAGERTLGCAERGFADHPSPSLQRTLLGTHSTVD